MSQRKGKVTLTLDYRDFYIIIETFKMLEGSSFLDDPDIQEVKNRLHEKLKDLANPEWMDANRIFADPLNVKIRIRKIALEPGQLIETIKVCRKITGESLAASKDFVQLVASTIQWHEFPSVYDLTWDDIFNMNRLSQMGNFQFQLQRQKDG